MGCSNIREILTCSLLAGLILGLCSLTRFLAFLHVKLFTSSTPTFSFPFTAKPFYKLGQKNIKPSAWHIVSGIDCLRKKGYENYVCMVQCFERGEREHEMYRDVSYRDRRSWGATDVQPIRINHNTRGVQNHRFLFSQGEVNP